MKTLNRIGGWMAGAWLLALVCGLPAMDAQGAAAIKKAPPKQQQARGSVVSCDEKMLILRVKKGEEIKFKITEESKFGDKGAIKTHADFKAGNHVLVTYVASRGERILKQVVAVVKHINP